MANVPSGWYRLGVNYDPATGNVSAVFDDETFNFTTNANLVGTFYVGYREGITGAPSTRLAQHNPPIFDFFTATTAGATGDYNNNGVVDAADYALWRDKVGTNDTLANNALPGPIGQAHYDQWRANFGRIAAVPLGQASGVPEPGSSVMIGIAIVLVAARRRCP